MTADRAGSGILTEGDRSPRRQRLRKDKRRSRPREEDQAFAGIVIGFARAVRRMVFGPPPDEEPHDDAGMAGSGVPRHPPGDAGYGSVALAEPITDDTGSAGETPHTRPSR